jgi:hypothetical protein
VASVAPGAPRLDSTSRDLAQRRLARRVRERVCRRSGR